MYVGAITGIKVQLEENEYLGKSSQTLMQHMASGLAASVRAGTQFDHTYMRFRKKSHELTRLHDRLFREAVTWQSRGLYDEAVNRYEMILSLGIGDGGLETELAATVICSYLYMVTRKNS
jgi:hypothetical protein